MQFLQHFHVLQNVTIVMFQVLDCGLSQSTCRSNSSPMIQRTTRQRRPTSVSNPKRTSSEPNKTFFSSPPTTLQPIRDTFSHSRAFSKKTEVILRVRRSTTWQTCLAEHRWTSEILDILPAFDTFRNRYLLTVHLSFLILFLYCESTELVSRTGKSYIKEI